MVLFLMLSQLLAAPPATPHIKMASTASAAEAGAGATIKLFVDVTPDARVHVYAPGARGYQPISLAITPRAGLRIGKLVYPKSQDWYFEPLKEHVPVYEAPFRLEQPVTLAASLRSGERVTVAGLLKYQACNDTVCFNPVSAPVSWSVTVK